MSLEVEVALCSFIRKTLFCIVIKSIFGPGGRQLIKYDFKNKNCEKINEKT